MKTADSVTTIKPAEPHLHGAALPLPSALLSFGLLLRARPPMRDRAIEPVPSGSDRQQAGSEAHQPEQEDPLAQAAAVASAVSAAVMALDPAPSTQEQAVARAAAILARLTTEFVPAPHGDRSGDANADPGSVSPASDLAAKAAREHQDAETSTASAKSLVTPGHEQEPTAALTASLPNAQPPQTAGFDIAPAGADEGQREPKRGPDVEPSQGTTDTTSPPGADQPAPTRRALPHLLSQGAGETARASRPVAVDSVRFLHRVTRAFQVAQERGGALKLRLNPPELGSLKLEVRVQDGTLTARLEAETPSARTALVENLPVLRERLAEQGIRIERFDVDLMQQQEQGTPDRSGDFESASSEFRVERETRNPKPETPTPPSGPKGWTSSTGLNVIV